MDATSSASASHNPGGQAQVPSPFQETVTRHDDEMALINTDR